MTILRLNSDLISALVHCLEIDRSDLSKAGAVNNCSVLVHFIFWKSKGLTWSDLSKAGAVNNCSVLVPCIAWKSKGLTWSDLDKAARKELPLRAD